MILVISKENDVETKEVTKWLDYYDQKYKIETDALNLFDLDYFKPFESIWIRKLQFKPIKVEYGVLEFGNTFDTFLFEEISHGLAFINQEIKHKVVVGNITKLDLNKISTLLVAKKSGLNVPEFTVSNSKKGFMEFAKKHRSIITKPITNIKQFKNIKTDEYYIPYTSSLNELDSNVIPEFFFPSFIQKKINKKLEIKGLFFKNSIISIAFYSDLANEIPDMKILLSQDSKIRITPYFLPPNLNMKIKRLFRNLALNIGTFDLIFDDSGNYFFLEINPCGQFDNIANISNSNIYEEIANSLILK